MNEAQKNKADYISNATSSINTDDSEELDKMIAEGEIQLRVTDE